MPQPDQSLKFSSLLTLSMAEIVYVFASVSEPMTIARVSQVALVSF